MVIRSAFAQALAGMRTPRWKHRSATRSGDTNSITAVLGP